MRLLIILVAFTFQIRLCAQPAISGVVNAFSGDSSAAPGTLVSIYGSNLTNATAQAAGLPLPLELGGTVVQINGASIPLYFVSPSQINAQIPFEVAGGIAQVRVRTGAGDSPVISLAILATAPGLLSRIGNGNGHGFVLGSGFQVVDSFSPGDDIVLYATGLGRTTPSAMSGAGGAQTEPLNRSTVMPLVYIGDVPAQVLYAGLAPGLAGVYQINVRVPQGIHTDRLLMQAGGVQSNTLSLPATYSGTTSIYIGSGDSAGTTFDFDSGVGTSQEALLQQSISLGARFFRAQNLGDPGTTHVFALFDFGTLTRIYAAWYTISISDAQSQLQGDAVSGPGAIFVHVAAQDWQNTKDFLRTKISVHELFHVLQNTLVGAVGLIGPNDVPVGGPRWLIEGSAEYMGYRAIGDAGLYPFTQAFADQLAQARSEDVTVQSLETLPGINAAGPNGAYPLMFIAVDFLTKKTGLPALAQFWRTIGTGVSWQDAFLKSFGESISQFYSDFVNYRASALPPLPVLSGKVVDVGGNPFPGISIYACPHNPAGSCGYALTGGDGSYGISVADNAYTLSYGRSSDGTKPDGFYSTSGFTSDSSKATVVQVAGKDIASLNVQMPFTR